MLGSTLEYRGLSPAARSALARMPRKSSSKFDPYSEPGVEPKLNELLSDPLTAAIMARDGVSLSHLQTLIGETRRVLRERRPAL
jgi:hypothetical protein